MKERDLVCVKDVKIWYIHPNTPSPQPLVQLRIEGEDEEQMMEMPVSRFREIVYLYRITVIMMMRKSPLMAVVADVTHNIFARLSLLNYAKSKNNISLSRLVPGIAVAIFATQW